MKRSVQEIIELLVFGLIAVLIGTGLLWVVGWAIGGLGALFKLLAGLIWSLLRFVVPIAVVGAAVYALVRLLQGQREPATSTPGAGSSTQSSATPGSASAGTSASTASTSTPPSAPPPAEATSTHATEPPARRAAAVEEQVEATTHEEATAESEDDVRRSKTEPGVAGDDHGRDHEDEDGTSHEDASSDEEDRR